MGDLQDPYHWSYVNVSTIYCWPKKKNWGYIPWNLGLTKLGLIDGIGTSNRFLGKGVHLTHCLHHRIPTSSSNHHEITIKIPSKPLKSPWSFPQKNIPIPIWKLYLCFEDRRKTHHTLHDFRSGRSGHTELFSAPNSTKRLLIADFTVLESQRGGRGKTTKNNQWVKYNNYKRVSYNSNPLVVNINSGYTKILWVSYIVTNKWLIIH